MSNLFGMQIIEHPLVPERSPRMTLSHKVPVSDEFRKEFDAWLLEFFGTEATAIVMSGKLFVNPANMVIIRGLP